MLQNIIINTLQTHHKVNFSFFMLSGHLEISHLSGIEGLNDSLLEDNHGMTLHGYLIKELTLSYRMSKLKLNRLGFFPELGNTEILHLASDC